jgi:hypothetical protein
VAAALLTAGSAWAFVAFVVAVNVVGGAWLWRNRPGTARR